MGLTLRRIAADGARSERTHTGAVTIGRAADSTVVLPGLLVAQKHLRLMPATEFSLDLECLTPIGVLINGVASADNGRLVLGDELTLGPHRIRIGLADQKAGLLIEIFEHDASAASRARTRLEEAGWRMRRPAVLLALLVVTLCLLLPLLLRPLALPGWLNGIVPSERLWSSGPVSAAHTHFGSDCSSCHDGLFARVGNGSCLSCHAGIRHHGNDAAVMTAAGLEGQRCASCHLEHGSAHAVLPRHAAICSDCHASPQSFASLANSGAATDFADDHPQFRVSVSEMTPKGRVTVRKPLTPEVKDASLLIYTHDLHVAVQGVRGPKGPEVLPCASCHRPDAAGVAFEPPRFERDCQRCHQLDVDFAGRRLRLPHGDNDTVRNLLQAAEARRPALTPAEAAPEEEERRRPGEQAERGTVTESSGSPIDEVFERQVCAKCHVVQRREGELVKVTAPHLPRSWMPMARFTHEPHRWVSCDSCHAAAQTSANSDDLMLPPIETCRSCHGGQNSSSQVPSTCIDCHRFHQAATLTMDAGHQAPAHAPPAVPKTPQSVVPQP